MSRCIILFLVNLGTQEHCCAISLKNETIFRSSLTIRGMASQNMESSLSVVLAHMYELDPNAVN